MTNFKFKSLKNKKIRAELVVLHDTTAFNITFLQRTFHFVSFLSRLFRKGELRLEAMTEPNLGGSYKKI